MIVFKFILFTLFITVSYCRTPDKVYCVNERCDGPISKARTLLNYNSPDSDLISFRANAEALVFMKSAGTNSDLWFVSINGKSGFASSQFLREVKIIEKNPLVTVPFIGTNRENLVQPDKVQQPHEVIEGTTIYTTEAPANNGQDTTTTSPVIPPDGTPYLGSSTEAPNQNVDNNFHNVPNPDNGNGPNINVISEQPHVPFSPEINIQKQLNVNNEENQSGSSFENPINIPEEVININSGEQNQPPAEQANEELPKELPSEVLAQQLLASSGMLNTEPILEVPEIKSEPEQTDNEHNTSLPNNNVENVPHTEEYIQSNNLPNNNINPNVPAVNPQIGNPIGIQEENIPSNINGVLSNENTILSQPNPTQLPTVDPTFDPTTEQTAPPSEIPILSTSTEPPVQSVEPAVVPNEMPVQIEPYNVPHREQAPLIDPLVAVETTVVPDAPAATIQSPVVANELPTIESNQQPTIPNEIPPQTEVNMDGGFPTTTETIPPMFSKQYPPLPTEETIPPLMMDSPSEPPPQELPSIFEHTTPAPIPDDSNQYNSAETTTSSEDLYATLTEELHSSTEPPFETENTGSFLSNMYSSVADIFPPTTEAPPSIYNTEEYPTYENENTNAEEGFSLWKYIKSIYYSVFGTSEESKALFAAVGETCFTDEYCDGTSNDGSNRLLTYLLTTASSVLLFTLGYYYIDNRRQDGRLIGTINSLQRDLLFSTKECEILKEELANTKNKLAGIEDSSFGMDDMVQSLKEEINELKATNDRLRNSLDDNEKLLRVSENTAGELQNTLGEVENTLSELLAERANSEEQILELNGKIQAFEEEFISISRERDNFQLKYVSAETALEDLKKQKTKLDEVNQLLADANNTIELQKHEIVALKDVIKELKSGMPSNVDVTSLIDHTEIKAQLSKALEEKNKLATKFESEHKERSRLAEELKVSQETLQTTSQSATEALTRLEVLGKYFQERESELMKELSAKESLWLSKQGESASTVEKIELLQQEVQRHKEKCDALTLELAEQESSRRTALSEVEARAHAAWLEARAARRDADAARDDAAALRRKLASLSAADGAVSPHHKIASPLDNVENPVLPPPLPPMFLPPPLLPPLPRPPPLGRLPSPHPPRYGDRRYSPDSRYSPQNRFSPDSRYSPETVRYSPDSRYSPRRRSPYSPRPRRRSRSRERYNDGRGSRSRKVPADTETEYNSDSPSREPRRRRYSRHSGPSSGSGCSSESDK